MALPSVTLRLDQGAVASHVLFSAVPAGQLFYLRDGAYRALLIYQKVTRSGFDNWPAAVVFFKHASLNAVFSPAVGEAVGIGSDEACVPVDAVAELAVQPA